MNNLAGFSAFQLNTSQMRNVFGGQEQFATCTTAHGFSQGYVVNSPDELFNYIDSYNDSEAGASDPIVGCENPWGED